VWQTKPSQLAFGHTDIVTLIYLIRLGVFVKSVVDHKFKSVFVYSKTRRTEYK